MNEVMKSRTQMSRRAIVCSALAVLCAWNAHAQDTESWNDMRVGMFVHWGIYSGSDAVWPTENMGGQATEWLQQWKNLTTDSYVSLLKPYFEPSATWADDLAQAAKDAGVEYVVITAKHHDGFTLFHSTDYWSTGETDDPSRTANPYGGSNISPAGRDLMQEFVAAVRAQGLKVGFYYSVIDWQYPNAYRGNNGLPKPAVMGNSKYDEGSPDPDPNTPSYKSYVYHHIEELMTQYGAIDELWFDFSSEAVQGSDWDADALMAMIRSHQPGIMVNNRLYDGLENPNGDFGTPERTIPPTGLPFDWETCQSWDNTSWGYKAVANGASYKTAREAARLYSEASSKGGNMLLNVGPDRFGAIPAEQATRVTQLGAWMAVNGEAIKQTRANRFGSTPSWGHMTMNKSGTRFHALVFDRPSDGVIDISQVAIGRKVNGITVQRLTASGPVSVPVNISGDTYTVDLAAGDLDALQSATFRIELDAVTQSAITWTSKLAPVDGSDILLPGLFNTTGTQVLAENVGAEALTWDGIAFAIGRKGTGTVSLYADDPGPLAAAANTTLVRQAQYGLNDTVGVVTLRGLTVGRKYRIQALVYDGRGTSTGRAVQFDGQDMGVYSNGVINQFWGPGRLVTGIFTATTPTQSFTQVVFSDDTYSVNKGQTLNALTLHDLGAVEPVTASISTPAPEGGVSMTLSWMGAPEMTYTVETNANLRNSAGWGRTHLSVPGIDGLMVVTNDIDGDQLFFRIVTE